MRTAGTAYLLDGLPVEVLGRLRSDGVMRRPAPLLKEYAEAYPRGGRYPKHGKEFRLARPETWGEPDAATTQVTDRDGELPIIEGTLIRLEVDRLPGGGDPCRSGCGPPPPA